MLIVKLHAQLKLFTYWIIFGSGEHLPLVAPPSMIVVNLPANKV